MGKRLVLLVNRNSVGKFVVAEIRLIGSEATTAENEFGLRADRLITGCPKIIGCRFWCLGWQNEWMLNLMACREKRFLLDHLSGPMRHL